MELEIYTAFTKAGISEDAARGVVDSIKKEIDNRYAPHGAQLATRGDVETVRKEIAEAKAEIVKWCMGSIFAAIGLFLALSKMIH
jgi:L-rhamnose isomerase